MSVVEGPRCETCGQLLTRRIPIDNIDVLAAQYKAGCTLEYLAARAHVSPRTLRDRLAAHGVEIRRPGRPAKIRA